MLDRNIQINGKDNFVDPHAKNVVIIGDNNKVFGRVSNVYIQGNGLTVDSSDVNIVDGVKLQINTKGRGEDIKYVDADYNVKITEEHYVINSASGNITIDLAYIAGNLYPGKEITFKKISAANTVTIDAGVGSATIDGATTLVLNDLNSSATIIYSGLDNNWDVLSLEDGGATSTTDHHSGYYDIISSNTVTVEENKQMTNWGGITIDGILNVDGQLIIEA
jgi:hypothetical protein